MHPPRRAVSEFPNDNPELHDGLVWIVPAPCAAALPTLRLRAESGAAPRVLGPSWLAERELDVEPAAAPPAVETAAGAEVETAAEVEVEAVTPFGVFVRALARVALERGSTRAAANLPALFDPERPPLTGFDPYTLEALRSRGFVEGQPGRASASFTAVSAAWRGVLEGTVADLSACGATTLDAWGASVLTAAMNLGRDRSEELRRELRRRGVAAFGLLAAA